MTALGGAVPLIVTVSGVGSGSFGGKPFTGAQFTVVLTSDNTATVKPICCNTVDLPSGTPATVTVQGLGTATITDNQTIFVSPDDGTVGLAHFNDGDLVDLTNNALKGYRYGTTIGPLTGTPVFVGVCPGVDCSGFLTSAGTFNFSAVSTVTFQLTLGAASPAPAITKIVDSAALGSHFAPGMPIEITGMNLGASAGDAATITIAGKPAPILYFANPTHVTAQIPVDAPLGTAAVVVTYKSATSPAVNIAIDALAPEIFTHTDTGSPVFYDPAGMPITTTHPASANSQIYIIAAGLGPTNPAQVTGVVAKVASPTTMPVEIMIGNNLVKPDYAGLFVGGLAGTYKILFKLPANVAVGAQPVTISVGGKSSNTATLQVSPPVPAINAIVNGATFKAKLAAPNSFVSIFGSNFGSQDTTANIFPAADFNGLSVLFDGTPAPLYYVFGSLGQINLVLPSELPETGTVNVQVKTSQGISAAFTLQMGAADIGMFRIADPSKASRVNGAVLLANTVWRVMPPSMSAAIGFPNCDGASPVTVCGQPAMPGDSILVFLTGEGKATPNGDPTGAPLATGSLAPVSGSPLYRTTQMPTVTIGGLPAIVGFSGITPGNAGLYQINTVVPDGVVPGDDVPIVVTMPGGSTDTVTIAVQAK